MRSEFQLTFSSNSSNFVMVFHPGRVHDSSHAGAEHIQLKKIPTNVDEFRGGNAQSGSRFLFVKE